MEAIFSNSSETPFTVGLGLHIHKTTRSKKLVDLLSNLNLCISYNKIMKIETAIGNAVYGKPLHFAIDNTDFRILRKESLNRMELAKLCCKRLMKHLAGKH